MALNEQINKDIDSIIYDNSNTFYDESGDTGTGLTSLSGLRNDLVNYITENYQPKTTSTDIEELRQRFYRELCNTHNRGEERLLRGVTIDDIVDFFAPHLSNKAELKKEAVRDFVDDICEDLIESRNHSFGSKIYENLTLPVIEYISSFGRKYLSSNEKEESEEK